MAGSMDYLMIPAQISVLQATDVLPSLDLLTQPELKYDIVEILDCCCHIAFHLSFFLKYVLW